MAGIPAITNIDILALIFRWTRLGAYGNLFKMRNGARVG
jgi:hypothetical protein